MILLPLFLTVVPTAVADAGVFTGNGQSLHQISSKTVQLVSIDVTIVLGRGRFLFDGSVPGMDQTEYQCKFVLRSLSDKPEEVQIGFPVDSEFTRQNAPVTPAESSEWVLSYKFIARNEKDTYHVDYVQRKPESGPGEFGSLFSWKMNFQPKETKTLSVTYHIPMSMGLVTTNKDEAHLGLGSGIFRVETLNLAMLEEAGYITSTGSSWAGNVDTATFTLITEPFERYLNHREVVEDVPPQSGSADAEERESPFPVKNPWWFRKLSPDNWKAVKGGVQWSYMDYKPKDSIAVQYYLTEFPVSPGDVNIFVDRLLKRLEKNDSAAAELTKAKDVLLATYGKEPQDGFTKKYVEEQKWYAPRKDFSMESLSAAQKAVLAKLDERIEKSKEAK
jgi:hypothetical protein